MVYLAVDSGSDKPQWSQLFVAAFGPSRFKLCGMISGESFLRSTQAGLRWASRGGKNIGGVCEA